jgi:phosphate transport system permease protein
MESGAGESQMAGGTLARGTDNSAVEQRREASFRNALRIAATCIILLLGGIFVTLLLDSIPSIKSQGTGFLYKSTWDVVSGKFGALPFLVGTLATSFLALAISSPFSLAISILLGEYLREGPASSFLKSAVDLLAGIPSVIYGFWALFVLVPLVRAMELRVGAPPFGVGILSASLVLSIMIIPYSASLAREVIQLVPSELKEAGLSLGATRFEVVRRIVLPYARSGIMAGALLALGRAIGETMAVTMVIGNSNFLPKTLFSPANTMASVIANEFAEASGKLHMASLVEIALLLLAVTTVINVVGRQIIKRTCVEV